MKNYAITMEESREFILNYKIKNDKIVIRMGNGKKRIVPYSKDEEMCILAKMELQVMDTDRFMMEQVREYKKWDNIFWISCILVFVKAILFPHVFGNIADIIIQFGLYGIETLSLISKHICYVKMIDLKKNMTFVMSESEINSRIKSNSNALDNVSNKTRKIIESSSLDELILTVNKIDNISYSDLSKIINNVYCKNINEGNVKRRVRKR